MVWQDSFKDELVKLALKSGYPDYIKKYKTYKGKTVELITHPRMMFRLSRRTNVSPSHKFKTLTVEDRQQYRRIYKALPWFRKSITGKGFYPSLMGTMSSTKNKIYMYAPNKFKDVPEKAFVDVLAHERFHFKSFLGRSEGLAFLNDLRRSSVKTLRYIPHMAKFYPIRFALELAPVVAVGAIGMYGYKKLSGN